MVRLLTRRTVLVQMKGSTRVGDSDADSEEARRLWLLAANRYLLRDVLRVQLAQCTQIEDSGSCSNGVIAGSDFEVFASELGRRMGRACSVKRSHKRPPTQQHSNAEQRHQIVMVAKGLTYDNLLNSRSQTH
jgi:hypothetical protein